MSITAPTIHFNGSSADHLLDDYKDASTALKMAVDALSATAPNARDYYVAGPDAFSTAQREHVERIRRLGDVHDEIHEIMLAVADQRDKRNAR
jgi:ferredoxin-NADP reductase